MECSAGISCVPAVQQEKCYDVVIVGFGPAALAQAIALYEHSEVSRNVLILEKSTGFSWRGKQIPLGRAKMRTNLMQDLVTARNPKSEFTFVNYLWSTDNLVGFTNLGSVNPPRELFNMYLEWCAKKFEELKWVRYGREVLAVEPQLPDASLTNKFRVKVRDTRNSKLEYVFAEKVLIAPGMIKRIPQPLEQFHSEDMVSHTSDFLRVEPRLLQSPADCLRIAIVGGPTDEAAEVLEHCMSWDRKVHVTLCTDEGGVQQTNKNPFAGNALLLSKTAAFETLSKRFGHARTEPSLQSEDLSSLYARNYAQCIRKPTETQSRFDVIQFNELVGAEKSNGQVLLRLKHSVDCSINSQGPFDFVFAATGYSRGLHEKLLEPLKDYFDSKEGGLTINADYKVNLDRRFVDRRTGIWMIDGIEDGADDAFPFMALRSERILRSIVSVDKAVAKESENEHKRNLTQRAVL